MHSLATYPTMRSLSFYTRSLFNATLRQPDEYPGTWRVPNIVQYEEKTEGKGSAHAWLLNENEEIFAMAVIIVDETDTTQPGLRDAKDLYTMMEHQKAGYRDLELQRRLWQVKEAKSLGVPTLGQEYVLDAAELQEALGGKGLLKGFVRKILTVMGYGVASGSSDTRHLVNAMVDDATHLQFRVVTAVPSDPVKLTRYEIVGIADTNERPGVESRFHRKSLTFPEWRGVPDREEMTLVWPQSDQKLLAQNLGNFENDNTLLSLDWATSQYTGNIEMAPIILDPKKTEIHKIEERQNRYN